MYRFFPSPTSSEKKQHHAITEHVSRDIVLKVEQFISENRDSIREDLLARGKPETEIDTIIDGIKLQLVAKALMDFKKEVIAAVSHEEKERKITTLPGTSQKP